MSPPPPQIIIFRTRISLLLSDENDADTAMRSVAKTDGWWVCGGRGTYKVILHDEYQRHDMTTIWQAQIAVRRHSLGFVHFQGFSCANLARPGWAQPAARSDIALPCHIGPPVQQCPAARRPAAAWRKDLPVAPAGLICFDETQSVALFPVPPRPTGNAPSTRGHSSLIGFRVARFSRNVKEAALPASLHPERPRKPS